MAKELIISILVWGAFTIALISIGSRPKEDTGIRTANGYKEQCLHYHHDEHKSRTCVDTLLVPK